MARKFCEKRVRWGVAVIAVALGGVVACGDGPISMVMRDAGEVMRDAGEVMSDASNTLLDAAVVVDSGDDAAAQPPSAMILACDREYTSVRAADDGSYRNETTYWYAEAPLPDFDPAAQPISATVCGEPSVEVFSPPPGPCPEGFTCTGERVEPYPRCYTGYSVAVHDGVLRVNCGSRIQSTTSTGTRDSGSRRHRAYVFFE